MITYEKKKEVFILWFLKRHNKREISRILKISRGSVDKIICECQKMIEELGLSVHDNLEDHIDKIVLEPGRNRITKPYKVNKETIDFIKKEVYQNEKLMRIGSVKAKSTKELFHAFKKQKKLNPNLVIDISLDSFYKYVRKIKKEINQHGL